MKKTWLVPALCIVLIVAVVAGITLRSAASPSFQAVVLGNRGGTLTVGRLDDPSRIIKADARDAAVAGAASVSEIQVGQQVKITFSGVFLESFPEQAVGVERIEAAGRADEALFQAALESYISLLEELSPFAPQPSSDLEETRALLEQIKRAG